MSVSYSPKVHIENEPIRKGPRSVVKPCQHRHHRLVDELYSVYYVSENGTEHHMKDFVSEFGAFSMASKLDERRIESFEL